MTSEQIAEIRETVEDYGNGPYKQDTLDLLAEVEKLQGQRLHQMCEKHRSTINTLRAEVTRLNAENEERCGHMNCLRSEILRLEAKANEQKAEIDKHRWIPVEARLPEDGGQVLAAFIRDDGTPIMITADCQGDRWCDHYGDTMRIPVTHWRQIILPEGETKETS